MTETSPCPACQAQVIEARDPSGVTVRLNVLPARKGKIAAGQGASGRWYARLLRPGELPGDDERRYSPHANTCPGRGGGLAELQRAQSASAAAARNRRGRWRPKGSNPFGAASGVRVPVQDQAPRTRARGAEKCQ